MAAILLGDRLTPIHYNALLTQMVGWRPSHLRRLIAQGTSVFDLFAETSIENHEHAQSCLNTGQVLNFTEVTVKNARGEEFIVEQTFIPVQDKKGNCVGVIVSYRDLTPEARMQARYKVMVAKEKARADELERRVEERTRQLAAALQEVTRAARTDPLTGLLNRRAFSEHAEQGLQLALRHNRTTAILMCDLDFFKRVNDTYGHQAGDALLKAVAEALQSTLRSSDKVARFGGEEFALLLTETTPEAVEEVALRCSAAVRQLPIREIIPGASRPQTISVGVSAFPNDGDTLDQLINCADRALYRAKETGRNRVVMYDPRIDKESGQTVTSPIERKKRVLIVEPDESAANQLREAVGDSYDVTLASAGTLALSYCARLPFDVLVTSEDVGTEDGVDFMYKTIAFLPDAVRLLVIASEDSFLAVRATNLGRVDQFILRNKIDSHLRSAIDNSLLRADLRRTRLPRSSDLMSAVTGEAVAAINKILSGEKLDFHYQPIIDVSTGYRVAFEALCRPTDPTFAQPADLFESAARIGSAWELGRRVRKSVVEDLPRLPDDVLIFINLHPTEINDYQLLDGEKFLRPWCKRVVFEITERAAVPDAEAFRECVGVLKSHGYRIAVDDLGAGYAGLSSVVLFSPDFIKIDRTMISGIDKSATQQRLVLSMVRFADEEGIKVIAEGIERQQEAEVVAQLGCHLMQGYHLGRPAGAETTTRTIGKTTQPTFTRARRMTKEPASADENNA
ncbi:MAG: EAL domain-containing protein [Deltaproteobacteria bacterium]|nr:EAL domain-containing protein [Deltaproteobacteria bacterium]